jgi:GDP-L-fucose synthase
MKSLDLDSRIYVAGHRGMVGSALVRCLTAKGYKNLLTATRENVDLTNQHQVQTFLATEKPDFIFLAAAKVGGIHANNVFRAEFLYENLMIQTNLIHGAHLADIDQLMFLGSSCIYPRDCAQPIKEEYLLSGPLEHTNEPYAIAKIAGIKLVETYNAQYGRRYSSVMPTNLYGPNDNYDLYSSHVLPALLRKAHDAKLNNDPKFSVWGSGNPRREFLHVDDLADACVFLMEKGYHGPFVNIGWGDDISIKELACMVRDIVEFEGEIEFDPTKPDGTPRKILDVSRLTQLGWNAQINLREGIAYTYQNTSLFHAK